MSHKTAKKLGLEPIYPENHELGRQIFWDKFEGAHYDCTVDLYLYNFDPVTFGKA